MSKDRLEKPNNTDTIQKGQVKPNEPNTSRGDVKPPPKPSSNSNNTSSS